jgi:hypothetical protein
MFGTVARIVELMDVTVVLVASMDVGQAPNKACHLNTRVRLIFSSPNAYLIIARVCVELLRYAERLIHTRC